MHRTKYSQNDYLMCHMNHEDNTFHWRFLIFYS
jgi:hypothetical protein